MERERRRATYGVEKLFTGEGGVDARLTIILSDWELAGTRLLKLILNFDRGTHQVMAWKFLIASLVVSLLPSCKTVKYQVQEVPNTDAPRRLTVEDWKSPRQMEVYFDGTSNTWAARTNVRRRFEVGAMAEAPDRPCLYVEGVGTDSLAGKIFGAGMNRRVLDGYKFLARNWRHRDPETEGGLPKDTILVFGFSRGAFQARMLAGLMAHCGLPHMEHWHRQGVLPTAEEKRKLDALAADVWDYCRENLVDLTSDESRKGGPSAWKAHLAANRTKLQTAMKAKHPEFQWGEPRIKLLAIWDTVPGLSFTKLSKLGEPENGRQLYKVGAYPNIDTIVHALSLDDRRSKFEPLPVGAPIDPVATNVYEVWFPGAHSDVGGGYPDSNDMSGASFNWLHRVMKQRGIATKETKVYEDSLALLHHPEDLWMHRLTSDNVARKVPAGANIDRTVFRRADGNAHPEENRPKYVVYNTKNPVRGKAGKGQILSVAGVPRTREAQTAYLQKLGLVLHDDTGVSPEKALPENTQPLSITQMAAAWNETPAPKPAEAPSVKPTP